MEKLIKAALTFSRSGRQNFLKQMQTGYSPVGVVVSCIDARVLPTNILSTKPGELYIVRNAGNFVPEHFTKGPSDVLGALELGCVRGNIKDVIICGHSDCKAMHLLKSMADEVTDNKVTSEELTPIQQWVMLSGKKSWDKWKTKKRSVVFPALDGKLTLNIGSDEMKQTKDVDVLSQINVLQQMSNVYTHPMLRDKLASRQLRVHGFWFNLNTGELHVYSQNKGLFLQVNEQTLSDLIQEAVS